MSTCQVGTMRIKGNEAEGVFCILILERGVLLCRDGNISPTDWCRKVVRNNKSQDIRRATFARTGGGGGREISNSNTFANR